MAKCDWHRGSKELQDIDYTRFFVCQCGLTLCPYHSMQHGEIEAQRYALKMSGHELTKGVVR